MFILYQMLLAAIAVALPAQVPASGAVPLPSLGAPVAHSGHHSLHERARFTPGPCRDPNTTADPRSIDTDGALTMRLTVTGMQGYRHQCSVRYNPGAVNNETCVDWLPVRVLDDEEDLDIVLQGFDVRGQRFTCTLWQLRFGDGGQYGGTQFNDTAWRDLDWAAGEDVLTEGDANMIRMSHYYLDAIGFTTFSCTPPTQPPMCPTVRRMEFPFGLPFPSGFPPPPLFRAIDFALAAFSMIFSVDNRHCTIQNSTAVRCNLRFNTLPGGLLKFGIIETFHFTGGKLCLAVAPWPFPPPPRVPHSHCWLNGTAAGDKSNRPPASVARYMSELDTKYTMPIQQILAGDGISDPMPHARQQQFVSI